MSELGCTRVGQNRNVLPLPRFPAFQPQLSPMLCPQLSQLQLRPRRPPPAPALPPTLLPREEVLQAPALCSLTPSLAQNRMARDDFLVGFLSWRTVT